MKNCGVCGSKKQKIVFEPLNIFRCSSCGFYYRDFLLPSTVYRVLPKYQEALEDRFLLQARNREAVKRTELIKKFVKSRKSLLEIGVGDGTLLEKLKLDGFTVTGIEPNLKMVEEARKKGLEVYVGTLEENEKHLKNKFDAVLMFHVLEHLNEPKSVLDFIHQILDNYGILILEVPGFDSPMFRARKWYASWISEEHLSYFTKKTLKNILKQTGFEIIYFKRRNWDEDCETLRSNIVRLPLLNFLYFVYRRMKERFEPFHIRGLAEWQFIEERIPQKGFGKLAVKLVNIFNRGDALFVVAKKFDGLPPRTKNFHLNQTYEFLEVFLLFILALLLLPFVHMRRAELKKILIVPTSKLGDLISQLPFFQVVRDKFPDTKLAVLLFNPTLSIFVEPYIDEIILSKGLSFFGFFKTVKEILSKKFGTIYLIPWGARLDFLSYFSLIPLRYGIYSKDIPFTSRITRSQLMTNKTEYKTGEFSTSVYLRLAGTPYEKVERKVYIQDQWTKRVEEKLEGFDLKSKKLSGILVGCGNKIKLWSAEKWAKVCDYLKSISFEVCLIGSEADKPLAEEVKSWTKFPIVDTTGLFTLAELSAFFEKLSFVAGVDSGPLYLANAVGTTVFDLVGPIDPKEQLPAENTYIVKSKVGCAPCSYVIATERFCRFGTRRCLEELMPEDVIRVIQKWLSEQK